MANNFRRTTILKKNLIVNESYKAKDCTKKFGGVPVLKFLQRLALDFPYISIYFPGLSYRQMYRKFQKVVIGLQVHVTPTNFFRRILRNEASVYKSYFFQNSRSMEIIRH